MLSASSCLPKGDPSADLSSAPSLTKGSRGEQVHAEVVGGLPLNSRPEQAVLVKDSFPKVEINVVVCKLMHSYRKNVRQHRGAERRWWESPNPFSVIGAVKVRAGLGECYGACWSHVLPVGPGPAHRVLSPIFTASP